VSAAANVQRAARGDARVVLVTGAEGQVGWEVRRTFAPLGRVVAVDRAEVDFADVESVRALVRAHRPAVIVNAAAYTAVDRAESERDLAFAINATAPRALAEEAARQGAVIVHFSTDYVFDGTKDTPYVEDDEPSPLNVYGESKLAGDRAVMSSGAAHLVFRTSWVYAARGHNFLRTMLALAHERDTLRVVSDQIGAPTPARLLAETCAQIVGRHFAGGATSRAESPWGIYNVVTRGATSWHGFAERILELDPRRAAQRCREVVPIPTSDYSTPARRPARSVLDVGKLERTFGLRMPAWDEQLALVMADLPAQP
jgi:dTDP-4-dehydrorhamnose reductase